MNESFENIKLTFLEKGIKSTLPRLYIYQMVLGFKVHFSAEDLFQKVQKKHPGISLATIYKTLDVLVQNKLTSKVVTEEDKVLYDSRMDDHIHLYCNRTKLIRDYEDPILEDLVASYLNKKGIPDFRIDQVQINLKGEFLTLKSKNKI